MNETRFKILKEQHFVQDGYRHSYEIAMNRVFRPKCDHILDALE
jgi:hypothetical protein